MTIEQGLRTFLLADADLAALVGTRVYPDAVPQEVTTFPALTYQQTDGDETPYVSGEANDLHRDTFELTAVSPERLDAARVRDRLIAMFSGTACRGTWIAGIFVSGAIVRPITASSEPPQDASERHDRQARVEIQILWGNR